MKDPVTLTHVVLVAKALGHPVRVRILAMLRHGPLCVCQLTAALRVATSTVSGHLLDLRRVGLVSERRDGKWVEYRLADDPDAKALMEPLLAAAASDPQVRSDRAILKTVEAVPVEVLCRVGLDVTAARDAVRPRPPQRRRPTRRRAAP